MAVQGKTAGSLSSLEIRCQMSCTKHRPRLALAGGSFRFRSLVAPGIFAALTLAGLSAFQNLPDNSYWALPQVQFIVGFFSVLPFFG